MGKSELGAALALNILVNDDEWNAEVYSCAADRQQASIIFDVACDMVRQSPVLSKVIKIIPSMKRMVFQPKGSIYQVLSSEVSCFRGSTIVQLADGTIKRADEVRVGDKLLSYDGLMPVFDEVVSVEVQKPSPVLEIRTQHNRSTYVTEEHPFYHMKRGHRIQDLTHHYYWKHARELEVNDRVAVALGWPAAYDAQNTISTLEAWALGAWAGDGDCSHFRFINPDIPVMRKLSNCVKSDEHQC